MNTEAKTEVIARTEQEWETLSIIRIDHEYFVVRENGGACGARNRQRGNGSWPDTAVTGAEVIDRTEARRTMLEWGYDAAPTKEATQ